MPETACAKPVGRRVLAVLGCVAFLIAGCVRESTLPANADGEWDALFQRKDGWTGGDAVYSVDLLDGRTLWLMADSWIGEVREGRHAPGSRLVNNSVGVHGPTRGGRTPRYEELTFCWGERDDQGHPTAWIVPDRERIAAGRDREQPTWYWVADGVVAPAPGGGQRLLIFLWHMGRRPGGEGVWNFESVGGSVAVIDDFSGPPGEWKVVQHENPHVRGAQSVVKGGAQVTWGSEVVLLEADPKPTAVTWAYIYGIRAGDGWNKEMVLARVDARAILDFDQWEFKSSAGWTRDLSAAAALADGMVSEFSVDRVIIGTRRHWVLVHSEPLFGDRILVRTSQNPQGPWSTPQPVYRVEGVQRNDAYFTYAAKAHPHLSQPGELLISYVINSHDFRAMVTDADIYRPRFVRLSLDKVEVAASGGHDSP